MQTTPFIPTAIRVAKLADWGIQNVPQAENHAAPGIQLLAALFIGSVDNSPVCVSTPSCGATPSVSGVNPRRDGRTALLQGLFRVANHQWNIWRAPPSAPCDLFPRCSAYE